MNAKFHPLKDLLKSPAYAGLFLLLGLLTSCKSANTPEAVSKGFWQAAVNGDLQSARLLATPESSTLIQPIAKQWHNAKIETGEIRINGNQSSVKTTLIPINKSRYTFSTYLIKVDNNWMVNYALTHASFKQDLLQNLIEGLEHFGNAFNKSIEKEIPKLQRSLEAFGDQLQLQLEQLQRDLEKPKRANQPAPKTNSI